MSKKAFDKIAAGLGEALEIARGNAKPAKLHVLPEISVREIRKKLGLSQGDFAAEFGLPSIKSGIGNKVEPGHSAVCGHI